MTRISETNTIIVDYESNRPIVVWGLGYTDYDLIDSNSESVFTKGEFDFVDNTSYNLHKTTSAAGCVYTS